MSKLPKIVPESLLFFLHLCRFGLSFSDGDVRLTSCAAGLYVALSLLVDGRLDLLGRLNVIVTLQELVELRKSFPHIFDADTAILIEIQT